ncbi:MAG TPA: polysaccharide deacetylase family protein [Chitinispirillaceae bacterium]|nr:polysaccharide deacetylase family protein [Chitinispirillaceae bacterium]
MHICPLFLTPFFFGSAGSLAIGRHSRKTLIPGLLFHSIVPKPGLNLSQCSVGIFAKFLKLLNEHHISVETIGSVEKAGLGSVLPKKVFITFDDGLESVSRYAIPLLDEFDFKSTVFCVAGFVGKSSTWDVYKESPHMSATDIRQLSDSGHEIGSHSQTHANLPYLNQNDLTSELRESKKNLEDITGKEVKSISFPHGCWNKRVWDTALELGYSSATLYRGHDRALDHHYPVISAHCFDSEYSLFEKINLQARFSPSIAFSRIASHFAKGTPLWKFRNNYDVTRSWQ